MASAHEADHGPISSTEPPSTGNRSDTHRAASDCRYFAENRLLERRDRLSRST